MTSLTTTQEVAGKQNKDSNAGVKLKCVICTTVKLPAFGKEVLDSFVKYHLEIGFSHIYIFFDDPYDASISQIKARYSLDQVTIFLRGDDLKSKWSNMCLSYSDLLPYVENEVQARQRLNCEVALKEACKKKYDWLLHIDSDELFYSKLHDDISLHFKRLMDDGVYSLTYLNFEGVPEKMFERLDVKTGDSDFVNYFKHVTLFRRHHSVVEMNNASFEGMKYWERRRSHGQYFLAYDIGKSAVRVLPNVQCTNVHKFTIMGSQNDSLIEGEKNQPKRECTAVIDARNFDAKNYYEIQDPVILHYVVCGLPWLRAKYNMLGAFPNSWYGGKIPIAPSFHRDARDLMLHNSKNNEDRVRLFYRNQVMLDVSSDSSEYKNLISSGVCERIVKPQNILKRKDGIDGPNQATTCDNIFTSNASKANVQINAQNSNCKNNDGNEITSNRMTYDRNWMIANAVKKFL